MLCNVTWIKLPDKSSYPYFPIYHISECCNTRMNVSKMWCRVKTAIVTQPVILKLKFSLSEKLQWNIIPK